MEKSTGGKKSARKQKYMQDYADKYPFIKKSLKGETFAYCTICRVDISIGHGGTNDIKKHTEKKKHIDSATAVRISCPLTSMLPVTSKSKPKDLGVIKAEVAFSDFLCEHNIPLTAADHSGKLFKKMFPDSSIAQKYSCARTKTKHVIDSLATEDADLLTKNMKTNFYSLATDGSTDMDNIKLYPVLVKSFDENIGQVTINLLALKECKERSTAANIFQILDEELNSRGIPWSRCISFACDNASVMVGRHRGVATHITAKNPNVYVMGCPCHLMHLAAQRGAKCLTYQIDELLVDIWYYIDKSQLRHQAIINLQREHGLEVRKILKHVSTRWLSLHKAVCRLLDSWDALEEFFKSESTTKSKRKAEGCEEVSPNKKPKMTTTGTVSKPSTSASTLFKKSASSGTASKTVSSASTLFKKSASSGTASKTVSSTLHKTASVRKSNQTKAKNSAKPQLKSQLIYQQLSNPNCKLFALFLKAVIPFFEHPNQVLQSDEPQIHRIQHILLSQFATLLSKFIKPGAIALHNDVTKLNLNDPNNHKDDQDIQIGYECRTFMNDHKEEVNTDEFFRSVKSFYISATAYMMEKYPLKDDVLIHAKVLNIKDRRNTRFESVEFFAKRFNVVEKEAMDELQSEFNLFQIDREIQHQDDNRIDQQWHHISQMVDPTSGQKKYPLLCKVVKAVLVTFHSNADCERVFSMVVKNKRKERYSMSTETLSSLVTHRLAMGSRKETCFATSYSEEVLERCKSATYEALKVSKKGP